MTKRKPINPKLFEHLQWKPGMPKLDRTLAVPLYGRFSARDIQEEQTGFVFIGLQIPIGTYSRLVLGKEPLSAGKSMTFQEWADYNANEQQVQANGGFRVMPAWIRYALANVCYQSKDQTGQSDLIEEIRRTVLANLSDCHNATSIELFLNNQPAMITHANGWPSHNPLNKVNYHTHLREDNRQSIQVLEALLYENNPQRVHEVSHWVMGRPSGMERLSEWSSQANKSRMMIWGDDEKIQVDVYNDGRGSIQYEAYGIRADPTDFKPI